MSSFSQQIAAFNKKAMLNADTVLRKSAAEVLSRLVLRSPVDTGRFRGNWQVGVEQIPTEATDALDVGGSTTISNGAVAIESARIGQDIAIVNNLPYAQVLENGSSQQAPKGMVAVTVVEWQGIVADAVEASK